MYRNSDLPVLYAENCPDEPFIPSSSQQYSPTIDEEEKISRAVRVISKKTNSQHLHNFQPKIIKSPKNLNSYQHKHSHEAIEHEREVKSLQKRIKECKNPQQRKKDKSDPVAYPPYFVRDNLGAKDVRIDGLYNKVEGYKINSFKIRNHNTSFKTKNVQQSQQMKYQENHNSGQKSIEKSPHTLKKYQYSLNMSNPYLKSNQDQTHINLEKSGIHEQQAPDTTLENPQEFNQGSFLPNPVFHQTKNMSYQPSSSKRPNHMNMYKMPQKHYSSQTSLIDLPENDIRSIIGYIIYHRIHKQSDLTILRMRMMHKYGHECMKNVWKYVMHLLQREA